MKKEEKRKKEKKISKDSTFDIRKINWVSGNIYHPHILYSGCECATPNPTETKNTEINNH